MTRMARILVLEDYALAAAQIAGALRRLGHRVVTTDSARSAIELADRHRWDLIVLDVVIEGDELSGIDVWHELSPEHQGRARFITAHDRVGALLKATGRPWDAKPFGAPTVRRWVEDLC